MRLRVHDPERVALKGALRTALVLPPLFVLCDVILGNKQGALFTAFGTIGFLVFSDFTGPPRQRLRANLGLALTGFVLIPLGTLCSDDTALATGMMAVVGFAILFSGILSGYAAAGSSAALLTFVLPVMIPGTADAIPDRLLGWGLACVGAIAAIFLLWPSRPQGRIRTAEADACRALATLLRSWATGPAGTPESKALWDDARAAVTAADNAFAATPYRPSGPSGPTAAMAQLVDDLDWILPFTLPPPEGLPAGFDGERARSHAVVATALDACAERLEGRDARPDLDGLDAVHDEIGAAFRVWAESADDDDALRKLHEAFRLRALTYAAWQVGRHALLASGQSAPAQQDPEAPTTAADLVEARDEVIAHATMRSVWLRNSLRGAVSLAGAVLIAEVTGVQNGFWVVLGTLAVLRSHALGTGTSIVDALLGTLAGIVVGGLIVAAADTHAAVLWTLLPIVVFLAAWSPRAVSFLAGQAAFSLMVLVFFNLIDPIGWKIGLVRVQDVAIGCGVSLLVGLLMWPRGAAAVVRRAVKDSYDASVAYTATTIAVLRGTLPAAASRPAHRAALDAHDRLDTAFRQFLGERRAPDECRLEALGILVAGAVRVRRTGHALSRANAMWRVDRVDVDSPALTQARAALDEQMAALDGWFGELGAVIVDRGAAPAPQGHDEDRAVPLLRWVWEASEADGGASDPALAARGMAWASEHLETLRRHEPRLAGAADRLDRPRGATA